MEPADTFSCPLLKQISSTTTSQHTQPSFPNPPATISTGKTLFKDSAATERFGSNHPEKMKNKNKDEKSSKNTFCYPLRGRVSRYWTVSERLNRAVFLDCASQIL